MTGQTVSTKRNRVYPHKFDHDLARQRRDEGWSIGAIAREAGVTRYSIRRAIYPDTKARSREHERRNMANGPICAGCGRQASRASKGRCADCYQADRKRAAASKRSPTRPSASAAAPTERTAEEAASRGAKRAPAPAGASRLARAPS